jgi:uncharacterized protein (DUF885 family)
MKALLRTSAMVLIMSLAPLSQAAHAAPAAATASSADDRFVALYTAEYTWRNEQTPPDEDTPKGNAPAHLPHVDEATQQKKLAYWQDVEKKLLAIDPKTLTRAHAEDYAVYRFQIETLIADQVFKTYQRPLSGDTSFWGDLSGMATGSFHSEADYQSYLSQLSDFPRYFEENTDNMRAGLKRGFTLPKVVLQGRDATILSAITDTAEANPYYAPFKTMAATLPADVQARLRGEAAAVIRDKVIPAHKQLLDFMRTKYVPGAVTSIAAYDLPDGKAFYRSQIIEYTTLDMPPEKIHQLGIDEVTKIKAEMQAVMDSVGFKGDLKSFNTFLRTDPQFYAKTPQELLDRAAWVAKTFDGKAADYFGRLPRQRFGIYPVAPDLAPFYTGGRGGPGVYYVNTYNLPSRPLYSIPALTLHESAPGHAMQMPLASENTALPQFRRDGYISAYGEGWALYCERLGDEMGIYQTPYDKFGMLSYQMWRAARLVVDTGIHSEGWTREQAQQYLLDNTALSTHEVTTEVDRYIAWPGQALSYYLGEMDIWANRAKAEKALGATFDIRAFHDSVLETGSVPLPVLDAHIDAFIQGGGKSPYADSKN